MKNKKAIEKKLREIKKDARDFGVIHKETAAEIDILEWILSDEE